MSFKEKLGVTKTNQLFRLSDFADWNMYKNYLFDHGNLNFDLTFRTCDWRKYLKKSGKPVDLKTIDRTMHG